MSTHNQTNSMTIAEALTGILLGNHSTVFTSSRFLNKQGAWPEALDVSVLWKVVPRLRRQLETCGIKLPEDQAARLQTLSLSGTARNMLVAHWGATAIDTLAKAGIQVCAFKGVGLLANLYQTNADRTVGDVDLLINEEDLLATCNILNTIGFSPQIDIPHEEWLKHIGHRIHPTHGYLVLMSADKVELDIHWCLGNDRTSAFNAKGILDRSETAHIFKIPIKTASPLDAIALTVHHIIRDYFKPGTTVKDLCDLSAWWETLSQRWQVTDMVTYALECGFSEALLALWSLLDGYNAEYNFSSGIDLLSNGMTKEQRSDAYHLRDLFYLQLREGALDPILVGLVKFNIRTVARFVSYEMKMKTRKASFKYLADQKKEGRLPFASRVMRLLGVFARINPKRFAMYRAAVNRRIFFQGIYEKQNQD